MTNLQRITLRLSEVRSRLNEISALEGDAFTDEVRAECDNLQTEYADLERRHRAAIVAQGEDEARAAGMFGPGDGEAGERGRLLRETTLAEYLTPAAGNRGIEGRARELNEALDVPLIGQSGGVVVPFQMLESRALPEPGQTEQRAFTTTAANDGGLVQRPILMRLFGPGVLDVLGVRLDAAGVGQAEFPIITDGVAPAQTKEATAAADPVVASIGTGSLKPKRLVGSYEFSWELQASLAGIEEALRADLAAAIRSAMSSAVINGVAPTETNPQHVQGFLSKLSGADLASAEAAASDYGKLHALAVDGLHAEMETQVMSVVGTASYIHASGVYITGSGESGTELLRRRSGGCVASVYIPAADGTTHKQAAILHAAGPNGGGMMRGDSVGATWPGIELIRDQVTQASIGVRLTWIVLWDAVTVLRPGAYKQIDVQIDT